MLIITVSHVHLAEIQILPSSPLLHLLFGYHGNPRLVGLTELHCSFLFRGGA